MIEQDGLSFLNFFLLSNLSNSLSNSAIFLYCSSLKLNAIFSVVRSIVFLGMAWERRGSSVVSRFILAVEVTGERMYSCSYKQECKSVKFGTLTTNCIITNCFIFGVL